jgi:hypothetical protein
MGHAARDAAAHVIVALPGGRRFAKWYALKSSQVFIVSYPKSGRTWLRFLVGKAIELHFELVLPNAGEVLETNRLSRLDPRVPMVRFTHDDDPHLKPIDRLQRDKSAYRGRDVVLLARDPRDVVVSSYYQQTRRARSLGEPGFDGTLSDFIHHPNFGIRNIVAFLNIWAAASNAPRRFMLTQYEAMQDDASRELRRVLDFIGLSEISADVVDSAVKLGSFDNMKQLERGDALGAGRMRPTDGADPESYKARRGVVGGYANELSENDRTFVDEVVRNELDPLFGYGD